MNDSYRGKVSTSQFLLGSKLEGHKDQRIVFRYLVLSLGFGVAMGLVFPLYASFFVEWKSPTHQAAFIAGCVVAGILVGLFSFLIGKMTVLKVICGLSVRLGELCDHEGDLSRELDLHSSDCLGELAGNFNRFQGKLRHMVHNLDGIARSTQDLGFELAANSTQTSTSSEQIARHMDAINGQTQMLMQEVDQADQARQGIHRSSHAVSEHLERQSGALHRLSYMVEESVAEIKAISDDTGLKAQAVFQSISQSGQNLEDIVRVARKIGEISQSAAQIGELVHQINETAERINVLGINASIEAAHAGEAGRGFGVVANEIRKLASQARQDSQQISGRLGVVLQLVGEGVDLSTGSEANLNQVLGSIRLSVDDIQQVARKLDGFTSRAGEMIQAHGDLVRVTLDVTRSMEAMRDDSGVIEKSMGVLRQAAEQNRTAIKEITLGMRDIAQDVVELNRVSAENARNVQTLHEVIRRFKVN